MKFYNLGHKTLKQTLIISFGLLFTLPKDSAGVGDVKENSQKAEIKIQIKSFFKKFAGWQKVTQL